MKDAAARRSEDQMWHSASLPRRRTTIDRNMTPELNAYIKGKALKGEVCVHSRGDFALNAAAKQASLLHMKSYI